MCNACNVSGQCQESPHVRPRNSRDDLVQAFVIIHPGPGPALNITADYQGYTSQSNTELHQVSRLPRTDQEWVVCLMIRGSH